MSLRRYPRDLSTGIVDYPLLLSIDSSLFWWTVGYRDRCAVGAEA